MDKHVDGREVVTSIPQSTPNVPGRAPVTAPPAPPDPARHGWPVINQNDNVSDPTMPPRPTAGPAWAPFPGKEPK